MEGEEEMCNFAFFYYADGNKELMDPTCNSAGPPAYSWATDPAIGNVPVDVDAGASTLS